MLIEREGNLVSVEYSEEGVLELPTAKRKRKGWNPWVTGIWVG